MPGPLGVILIGLTMAGTSWLRAADYYWDENGATAGFGTAGTGAPSTWAAPTPGPTVGWSTDNTGGSAIASVTTTSGDTVNFGTDTTGLASGTVTLSGTVNASSLKFGKASGDINLSGGTISMDGGTEVIQASSGSGSVSTTHIINSNITKSSGTLRFGTQNTTNEKYIVNGVLSGGFALDGRMVNSSGVLTLNGLNTFSGNASIVTGQINANSLADTGSASSLGAGSIISMGGGGGQQPRLVYTGTNATSTNRTFRSTSTGVAGIVAQDGALDLTGSMTTTGAGTYNFALTGTADTGTNAVSGVISDGSGKINVRVANFGVVGVTGEDGYWVFSGANTYTGTTSIEDSSTLQLGNGGTAGSLSTSSAILIENGSAFVVNQSDIVSEGLDFSGTLSGAGDVIMAGSGTLELLIDGSGHSGDTIVNNGTLRLVNTADLRGMVADDFFINNGSTLEIESSVGGNNRTTLLNDSIFTFDSNGGGNIDFVSGNHLAQTGSSGTARLVTTGGSQNTITSSAGGFINPQGSGNHVRFDVADGTDDVDLAVSVTITNGTWRKDGAGTLSIIGSNSSVAAGGAININAGTFEVGGNGQIRSTDQAVGSGIISTAINNEGIFKHNTALDQTIQSVISGTGALVKDNSGTLTLAGSNSYTGATTVSAGTLVIDGSLTNEGGLTVASGATLAGSGIIGGLTTIEGIHSPGNSPGIENFTNLTYNGGASINWELIGNTTSGPGTNFDRIMVSGDLDFNGATTLNLDFKTASAVDWTDSFWGLHNIREWQIFGVTGTTTGFSNLDLNVVDWQDGANLALSSGAPSSANFYLFENNNSIYLRYEALPEPATFGLLGLLMGVLTLFTRPRQKMALENQAE